METSRHFKNGFWGWFIGLVIQLIGLGTCLWLASVMVTMWSVLPEKGWVLVFTALLKAIYDFVLRRIQDNYMLTVRVRMNSSGRKIEERSIDLSNENFQNSICKLNFEVAVEGKTKGQDLLIQLDPGVSVNFVRNQDLGKHVKYANILTDSRGEKGLIFTIPQSDKSGHVRTYNFSATLEQDEEFIDYESAYSVKFKGIGKVKSIFSQVVYNTLTIKVFGESVK